MRIIGLDVGEKRIGVSRVDTSVKIAVPVGTITADKDKWQSLARLSRLYDTTFFVLGLPRSNEGNETAQSLYVRNFAKDLVEKIPGAKIRFQDESLTSVEAEKRLKARRKSYEKGEIDAEAATIILQDFIENFQEKPAELPKDTNLIKKSADKAMLKSKKAAHKTKKTLTKFLIIPPIFVIIGLFVLGGYLWYQSILSPLISKCDDANTCEDITFPVAEGETADTIATNLQNANLIKSSLGFKIFLKLQHPDATLKSGTYTLNRGLSISEITDMLIAGAKDSSTFSFTILPGETIMTIKNKLIEIGYSTNEVDNAFGKQYDFDFFKDKPANTSLEGYLFGETHEFYKNESVENILKTFLTSSQKLFDENNLETEFAKRGFSIYEGLTFASIIQKETFGADMPIVASIFYNRLDRGQHLGSDATIKYYVDLIDPKRSTYKDNQTILRINSCYNTGEAFGNAGLPCGPISSPSLAALLAVANPADTDYLYFLTGDDGKMYYSSTEAGHNQNARKYCQVLCNIAL